MKVYRIRIMLTNRRTTRFFLLLSFLLLSACSTAYQPVSGCEKVENITPICGFKNPEDMELLPDQKTLIVSQVGWLGAEMPGGLVFFDTESNLLTPAFPVSANTLVEPFENWGGGNCPGIPGAEFSPLGISSRQRGDGRWQLAAVNLGRRISVEMFELQKRAQHYALAWRGCVLAPEGVYPNDLALTRQGGFVASHMFDHRDSKLFGFSTGIWKSQLGFDTGYVIEWAPEASASFRILKESHGAFMNGIQLSADDQSVYVSETSGNQVRKLDRISGKQLGVAKVTSPDNLAWSKDGYLLVASLDGGKLANMACFWHPGQTCALGFSIVRIKPQSMTTESIFQHEGAPMGAATVAQQVGAHLYLGSFTGDRIIKIPYVQAAEGVKAAD